VPQVCIVALLPLDGPQDGHALMLTKALSSVGNVKIRCSSALIHAGKDGHAMMLTMACRDTRKVLEDVDPQDREQPDSILLGSVGTCGEQGLRGREQGLREGEQALRGRDIGRRSRGKGYVTLNPKC
jgi:hypothetical protein